VTDLLKTMTINKEIIKTLIEAQGHSGDDQVKRLQQALMQMKAEN
jgi:hypothetical protein